MGDEAHIAVVDDDPDVRAMIGDYLARHGFAVSRLEDGAALRALMAERPVDLCLLDIGLPGEDGLSIARALRVAGPVGIIMVTASGDDIDKVVGLEIGADDYVAKPFNPRELLARVRATLRRLQQGDTRPAQLGREVRVGRCLLNLDSQRLFTREGKQIPLTAMEFDLLEVFARHPNRVLSRDRLLDLAHSKEDDGFDRSIDTRVSRLRAKVEENPSSPRALKTVRGVGYMFVPGGHE